MIQIIYFGYRNWSKKILVNLTKQQNTNWKISHCVTIKNGKTFFQNMSIPTITTDPDKLTELEIEKIITPNNQPLLLFYGWSWMIPKSITDAYTCLILHPSPLPKYRGGSPIQNQIIAGETSSAVTLFKAEKGLDDGPIYAQKVFSLNGNLNQIISRIIRVGTQLTIQTLSNMLDNSLQPYKQNELQATFCKRRKPSESEITLADFESLPAETIYNKIRSLQDPYPNAYIMCKDGKKLYFTGVKLHG